MSSSVASSAPSTSCGIEREPSSMWRCCVGSRITATSDASFGSSSERRRPRIGPVSESGRFAGRTGEVSEASSSDRSAYALSLVGARASLVTASELRRSGIALLGDVGWGTHLCCFFRTTDDLLALLVPYFKAGLESHEYCIWVLSGGVTKKLATAALRQSGPDLDRYLAGGRLDIRGAREWYLTRGRLDRRRGIRGWLHRLRPAQGKGFAR